MEQYLQIIISGIAQGAVYSVFAFGLSLVYGIARVLNFAHGSFYMAGAYIAWILSVGYLDLGYPAVFAILVPALFAIGLVFERLVIRPLRSSRNWRMATMMVTLGFAFFLDNLSLILFGPQDKLLPPFVTGRLVLGGMVFSHHEVAIFAAAVAIVIALELFLYRTMIGSAMRAIAQDVQGARMVGIDTNQVSGYTFGLSVVLAGVAGVLLAPIYLISPLGGWPPFLKAFVIVVFGGLGSTRGVLYAALILGVVEALVIFELGATWIMPVWLLTLLVVLMVRPQGLLGVWGR
ncbi:MAG TPA: branched-chain amino acid ABC transporter permease [Alphaproteobacteria bacterium]|nr:branched-chain amino acid ABC transporter permease [Alphaproteobacteria bacterium]